MRVTNRGLWLLITLLFLWAVGGYAFHRIDSSHDEAGFRLLRDLIVYKTNLAEATPGPRVIVAGGSNAYYGIDSDLLQARLGMPVVNVALPFGAHHPRINLALVEDLVRRGDIVLFAVADFWHGIGNYASSERRMLGFDAFLVEARHPGYERQFNEDDLPWAALPETNTLLLALLGGAAPAKARPWALDTDKRGDFTGCVPRPVVTPVPYGTQGLTLDLADEVRASAARLQAKGVQLLVVPPWLLIREQDRDEWAAALARHTGQYEPEVPVLAAHPAEVLRTDHREFCDSPEHLTTAVTRWRSESLASALRRHLERGGLLARGFDRDGHFSLQAE